MEQQELDQAVDRAAQLIVEANYVVALVGAGLSAESGVPTFRGPDGLWTKMGEPDMRGYERFIADPKKWWEERTRRSGDMQEMIEALERAVPNDGHYALKDLEDAGLLKHIVTQNIDNLHQVAGSQNVTEIHGNRTKLRCIGCSRRWDVYHFDIDYDQLPPRCLDCGGLIKTDTVMFGEPIPRDALNESIRQAQMCDCMLLIGTSAAVYPAAGLPDEVLRRNGCLIEVNPNETPLSPLAEVVIRAPSGEILPRIVEEAKARANR